MFREMRRKGNALSKEEAIKILGNCTNGVLAVSGDNNYPYAVPLSYVYDNNKIIFHCATSGHKLDAIATNEKVSFCVISEDHIIPEEFNTLYQSVIAFGKARILTEESEKKKGLELILKKYSSDYIESGMKYIEDQFNHCEVVEITIEQLTGKAGD